MTLGRTLFIVNPAARHGETRKLVPAIQRTIEGVADGDIQLSAGPRHGFDLARTAEGFDTIVAVGGDGTAHEVLNGVMAHEPDVRPTFAVVPTGSGNDYAHTLGKFNAEHPYWMNYHWRVFRAKANTSQLTVSDWASDTAAGGPAGQELMYNFLEIQPYIGE